MRLILSHLGNSWKTLDNIFMSKGFSQYFPSEQKWLTVSLKNQPFDD